MPTEPCITPLLLAAAGAAPLIAGGLALVALLLSWPWYRSMRRKRLVEDVPTSKVRGVAIGLTEVKGVALRDRPFTSYLAGAPTVWYRYNIAEHWRKTVTEHYTDSNGKRKTRRKTESGWKTVQSDEVYGRFGLADETGSIRIDPRGATVEGRVVFSETCGRHDPLYYGKGPAGGVSHSTGQRSFTEHAIVVNDPLYVIGSARVRDDIVEAEIAHDPDDPMFVISTRSEEQIVSGYGRGAFLYALFGTLFSGVVGALLMLTLADDSGVPELYVVLAALAGMTGFTALLSVLYALILYNGLVRVRSRIGRAWAMIEVQLQRRADLVPRLASVVKGYADHERAVQEDLAGLRADALTGRARAPRSADVTLAEVAADRQTALLDRLLAVVEAYPDLRANTFYLDLQRQLADTEDRIALARSFYNETVTAHNVRIASLPDVLFARPMGFRRVSTYTIEDFERRPVRVDLGAGAETAPPIR